MTIRLEMLRVFCAVAEKGSLLDAAQQLGRSVSAISMTLGQLQDELGAPLFETDRKNRLTKLGELVLEEAVRATDSFDRGVEGIRRVTRSLAGTIRIAAVPSAAVTLLPGLIADYRKLRPEVRFEISDLDSAAVHKALEGDAADIGLASDPGRPGLENHVLQSDTLGIAYRKGGPIAKILAAGDPSDWSLLEREILIANPLCAAVGDAVVQRLAVASPLHARNTTTLIALVRAGLGATVLPDRAIPQDDPEICFFVPSHGRAFRAIHALRDTRRRPSPVSAEFWQMLVAKAFPEQARPANRQDKR